MVDGKRSGVAIMRRTICLLILLCVFCAALSARSELPQKPPEFTLPECRFMNRCNGTDFRIVILGGDLALAVSKVELMRAK